MNKPMPGESKDIFIKRCASQLIKEESMSRNKALVISEVLWERRNLEVPELSMIDLTETQELLAEADILGPAIDTVTRGSGFLKDMATLGTGLTAGGVPGLSAAAAAVGTKRLVSYGVNALKSAVAGKIVGDIIKAQNTPTNLEDRAKPIPSNLASFDSQSNNNKIKTKPQGIVIQDTWNNPIFPIPEIQIDTHKFNLPLIYYHYKSMYTKLPIDFLPWHYVIEIIDTKYFFFATRPFDMQYPVSTQEAQDLIEQNKIELNESSKRFFLERPFDLRDAIHVCIIGDTSRDVYLERLYEMIGRLCAGPYIRFFHMPNKTGQRVINFNLGSNFHFQKLDQYLMR